MVFSSHPAYLNLLSLSLSSWIFLEALIFIFGNSWPHMAHTYTTLVDLLLLQDFPAQLPWFGQNWLLTIIGWTAALCLQFSCCKVSLGKKYYLLVTNGTTAPSLEWRKGLSKSTEILYLITQSISLPNIICYRETGLPKEISSPMFLVIRHKNINLQTTRYNHHHHHQILPPHSLSTSFLCCAGEQGVAFTLPPPMADAVDNGMISCCVCL